MPHQILKSLFREISTHPGVGKVATGGKLGGTLASVLSTAKGIGRAGAFTGHATLGTGLGRIATGMAVGTAVGGIAAYRSSDQYSSTNSTVNRMMLGAAFGAAGGAMAGAGFNLATRGASVATSRGIVVGRGGLGRISAATTMVGDMWSYNKFRPGTWSMREMAGELLPRELARGGVIDQLGWKAFGKTRAMWGAGQHSIGEIISKGEIGSIARGTLSAGLMAAPIVGAGALGYGAIKVDNRIRESRRVARVARFQDSASGLVQGMHRNR